MKKILGLDLGSASIGWAVVLENGGNGKDKTTTTILGLGSRIIPYEGTEGQYFKKGSGESKNSLRTQARTARKGYDRYQMRRKFLIEVLLKNNWMPDEELKNLPKMRLWELRSKAADSKIGLNEFGRILIWLNQKRGYKCSRSDSNLDKKDTDYVAIVKSRYDMIRENNLTVGQYIYNELIKDPTFRAKEKVFPREAYIEEFDRISKTQQKFHPVLTENLVERIRNEIIYYQRPLKSQKGLVSVCEFEGFWVKKENKEYFVGPRVAPKSSPIFQISKIWENINNIKINSKTGNEIILTSEQKWALFSFLDNNEKLTSSDLLKILNLRKGDCFINKQLAKGLQGNITKIKIISCFPDPEKYASLLKLELKVKTGNGECFLYDRKTGEVLNSKPVQFIDPDIEKETFYRLWHTIYSINDLKECSDALQKNFGIERSIADRLAGIDFAKQAFGNKSIKAIRKILPYLIVGDNYSDSMSYAGYDHSNSLTKEKNLERKLEAQLKPVLKNSLRQPVVEKILNQMVNVVNAILEKYGRPDEIRVELARELKQSRDERNDADKEMSKRQRENEDIIKRLAEFNLPATRNNTIKVRLYDEIDNEDKKLNAMCIYCGQPISWTEAINGNEVDVEHIIPKSKLFDDSQSNKTLAHRRCNTNKKDLTAFDFMQSKSDEELNNYIERVNMLYHNRVIGKSKREKLLMTESKIPDDFIDRQLRESQYISRKAREILQTVCYNVWSTSGKITSELRHLWGWDDITMNLQFSKYKQQGLTEFREWESDHGKNSHKKEIIKSWTKRDDHRHHAIDALVIACTQQGFIQRFNTLNAAKTKEQMLAEISLGSFDNKEKLSLLEKYVISKQPISIKEVEKAVAEVLISFKSGKKVAVKGTRKIGKRGNKKVVQRDIIVPRGPLSEESVYGKIKTLEKDRKLKYLFENPQLIVKKYIRDLVETRLIKNEGDARKALNSLKKDPIFLDKGETIQLDYATCYKDEYVIKYPVNVDFNKVDKVIDKKVKTILENRLNKFGGKAKEAFKDVLAPDGSSIKWYEDEGLKIPIKSVRCYTFLSAVVPVKSIGAKDIGFVKPGNNHHIAIYSDNDGNFVEHVCTFWHAVERKKYHIPVVIQDSNQIWDKITEATEGSYPDPFLKKLPEANLKLKMSMQQNEMFLLGLSEIIIGDLMNKKDFSQISDCLYRTQKLATNYYVFRHHLETELVNSNEAMTMKRFYRIQSIMALLKLNPVKVRVNPIGEITIF